MIIFGFKWVKIFKNGPSKTFGRQHFPHILLCFTILEYLDPYKTKSEKGN